MNEATANLLVYLAVFAWVFSSVTVPFYLYAWLAKDK
jgi:hypothetical protein